MMGRTFRFSYVVLVFGGLLAGSGCATRAAEPPAAPPATQEGTMLTSQSSPEAVIISLRRDSLGLALGAADTVVQRAMDQALATLQQVKAFEVLATFRPILAVKVRPGRGVTQSELIGALANHRLVLAAEPDTFVSIDTGSTSSR